MGCDHHCLQRDPALLRELLQPDEYFRWHREFQTALLLVSGFTGMPFGQRGQVELMRL